MWYQSEKDIIESITYKLMIISSLISPENTFLLFGKLKNLMKNWFKDLTDMKLNKKYDYEREKPKDMKKLLRERIPDSTITYFTIKERSSDTHSRAALLRVGLMFECELLDHVHK